VGAFLLAIVTAGALAHVGVRLKSLEVAYDLGRERRIATDREEQRRRLQIEIGMLKDPGRVISIAREKLDMGPPLPEAIWRIGSVDATMGPNTSTKPAIRTATKTSMKAATRTALKANRSPAPVVKDAIR
jgi:cell division protein FtsL